MDLNTPAPGLRETKKRETRQLISDHATRLFIEQGFERTTIAEIADAARVAKKTVTNYFPRKEDLALDHQGPVHGRPGGHRRRAQPGEDPARGPAPCLHGVGGGPGPGRGLRRPGLHPHDRRQPHPHLLLCAASTTGGREALTAPWPRRRTPRPTTSRPARPRHCWAESTGSCSPASRN
ncbi:TetR/AcrR family transcriptional regulator [Streptomyces thinghirensis]|nr:TetR/AcrR family transcriptional regulator [Streptomyces thinghirensis]